MVNYKNGDYLVSITSAGTKTRRFLGGNPIPEFPETIDVKITDYCNAGCVYCHEMSTVKGKHADLDPLIDLIKPLPAGVELAIGGGDPLSHPSLDIFLQHCAKRGLICNITVNALHIRKYIEVLNAYQTHGLIHGIGISAITENFQNTIGFKNEVHHYILGRFRPYTLTGEIYSSRQLPRNSALLFLGYKEVGRGITYLQNSSGRDIARNILWFRNNLYNIIDKLAKNNNIILFDNLALQQLMVKEQLPSLYDSFYMGPDGMFSMFIDAVEQQMARSSTTSKADRVGFNTGLLEYFREQSTDAFAKDKK